MDIIIRNVTGKIENDYYISELSRCGYPAGSIVRNVEHRPSNNGCYWSSGTDNCVAYIGKTCAVRSINFNAEIVREHTHTSAIEELGTANCSMEMFIAADSADAEIVWLIEYDNGDTDVEHIGLWFENRTLTDFDGLFSLPEQAKKLIRLNGFHVPNDF